MNRGLKIVADGLRRIRGSSEYQALRERLLAEARLRHGKALGGASSLRRVWIRLAIERGVRAELERTHPSTALYAANGRRGKR
jgi:hypothetical protein